jgi:hypothetical protein
MLPLRDVVRLRPQNQWQLALLAVGLGILWTGIWLIRDSLSQAMILGAIFAAVSFLIGQMYLRRRT